MHRAICCVLGISGFVLSAPHCSTAQERRPAATEVAPRDAASPDAVTPAPSQTVAAEEEQPRTSFPPLNQEQFDLFLDSVRSSVPLKLPQQFYSQRVDANLSGIWAGSKTTVDTSIGEIVLRFRRKTSELVAASEKGEGSMDKLLEQFELSVSQETKWLLVRHSNPEKREDLYGMRTRADKPKVPTRTPFIRGQRDSGMYISIPPFADPTTAWGILICPRRMMSDRYGASGLPEYSLGPSPYELSEINFSASAVADATMATAGQEGRLQATLKLSKDLPESVYSVDASESALPRIHLVYKTKTPFDFFRFAPYDDVQQGVLMEIEMQNKAGYTRKESFRHIVYVHKMNEPSPISVVTDGRRVAQDIGECYTLVVQRYSWMEYEKRKADF